MLVHLFNLRRQSNYKIIYKIYNLKKKKRKGVEIRGVVIQCLSNGIFLVNLENGFQALTHLSGKIRQNHIRILLGDQVLVELSPYDLKRGRILFRLRQKNKRVQ